MSEQEDFETNFERLTPTQVRVLEQFVVGKSDNEIAANFGIKISTVRKYIQQICDTLDIGEKGGSSRRSSLVSLIAKFKPELINSETPSLSTFDPDFVGRDDAMQDIDTLANRGTKCILILSPGGRGKTTLAWRYLQSRFTPDDILYFPIAKETKDIASIESLVEERLKKLGEEPGREFMVSLERLREKLTEKPMGVLIDNLEPALDESHRFIAKHRSYLELFKQVLLSPQVQSITLITSRAPLQEGLDITPYPLKPLNAAAWQAYFENESIVIDAPALEEMHGFYNGNTLAMRVLCHPIRNDYEGDLAAYWADCKTEDGLLVEERIQNLFREQFKTLERLHPNTHKLLCRMGCYRYQDVPTVPKEGLFCLLWDVPKLEHQRIVRALKDRALVDFVKGEYRLHPAIRAEALQRLRDSEDWEKANRVAAEFWTDSVETVETTEDAITAFEAYYHFVTIKDFDLACKIILKERKNKWFNFTSSLGKACYRLSLWQQCIFAINQVAPFIKRSKYYHLSKMYNILGDLYWMIGRIYKAIKFHRASGILAKKSLESSEFKSHMLSELNSLQSSSLFNQALCYLDLWELEKAMLFFETSVSFSRQNECIMVLEAGTFCLAFLKAYFGDTNRALDLITECNCFDNASREWASGHKYLFIGLAYKNIGKINNAFRMFRKAICYAEESDYKQVKAKALTGLAELYRIENDFSKALSHHRESIQILERIGAKCDLAEAYYQLALTQQKMGNPESQIHFDKAIELWREIDAPKQIERVRNSIERHE